MNQKELLESNSVLSEERATLSKRLAIIHELALGHGSDAEKIATIKETYEKWVINPAPECPPLAIPPAE